MTCLQCDFYKLSIAFVGILDMIGSKLCIIFDFDS